MRRIPRLIEPILSITCASCRSRARSIGLLWITCCICVGHVRIPSPSCRSLARRVDLLSIICDLRRYRRARLIFFLLITCTTHRRSVDHLRITSITCATRRPSCRSRASSVSITCVTRRPHFDPTSPSNRSPVKVMSLYRSSTHIHSYSSNQATSCSAVQLVAYGGIYLHR